MTQIKMDICADSAMPFTPVKVALRFRRIRLARNPFCCRTLVVTAAVALVTTFQPTPAVAGLLAYDGFGVSGGPADYLAGDDSTGTNVLGGQNPATGPTAFYSGGWIQSGGDAQAVKDIGSLAYPLFPQSGGQVNETVQFSCCSFGRSGRPIAGGLGGGRDPLTIYQSFLIDFGTQGTDDPTQFGFRGYEMWNGGVGDSFRTLGLFVNHFSGVTELTLQLTTPSGSLSQAVGGGGLTLDALAGVHLVVLRFDFNPDLPGDQVMLYLDPTDSIESNYTPAASILVGNSDLFFTHHGAISNFTFSGDGHIPGSFDEVRWGDTFADVTPFLPTDVPEPGTLGMLAFALTGLAVMRRR
jgi:hypothetical protein